jgi:hypothetical protein
MPGARSASLSRFLVFVDTEHGCAPVAEQELEQGVLRRLETRSLAEHIAELRVFARCQRVEHHPLVIDLVLYMFHPREMLYRRWQVVIRNSPHCGLEFVNDQLDPEFRDLMLDDEQHLVVVRRIAERPLGVQQRIELQVRRVIAVAFEVGMNGGFELALFHGGILLVAGNAL